MKRIRYWYQETMESGRWCLTGLMPDKEAEKMLEFFQTRHSGAEIVEPEDADEDNPWVR